MSDRRTGCLFKPYVMGVMVNQRFKIRNKGQVSKKSFLSPEVMVRFKCDVHPWMFAYVGVVDNPYFGVTGKDGIFRISGVPNGKYTIEAYHPKTHGANPGISKEITVTGDTKVDFTVDLK